MLATSPAATRSGQQQRRPWRASLRRSARLLGEFRHEQRDPDRFYTAQADDAVDQLLGWTPLEGATVLDVGGGRGYLREPVERVGGRYLVLDVDRGELVARGLPRAGAIVGDGTALPVRTGSIDVCFSSGVLEHVLDPWELAREMVRVTRPRGTVFISYTCWWGPWGGHETAPWHYLGGARARRRYRRRHGREPKNAYGTTLFALTTAAGLRWAAEQQRAQVADVVAVQPRYNPRWSHWLVRVPVLRELVTWNLAVVVRKR